MQKHDFKNDIDLKYPLLYLLLLILTSCGNTSKKEKQEEPTVVNSGSPLHVVFVTGDEEYRSEESMPMLARLVKRELGAKVTVCYSVDSTGMIDPNRTDHIKGLDALESADLMVLFTRFRNLPKKERDYITNYTESGKPIVGFRTATHAFFYENDTTLTYWNNEWPAKVFGQQWITHHGHFEDGNNPLTAVSAINGKNHPILNGFEPFEAYSWLYHVEGGEWHLYGDSEPLLSGRSLRSKHEEEGRLVQYPLHNPVAWTKSYTGNMGKKARVFFTTLGHPYDFKIPAMRRLSLHGMYWALGKEAQIPQAGVHVALEVPYEPNNSGFGQVYKKNRRPEIVQ